MDTNEHGRKRAIFQYTIFCPIRSLSYEYLLRALTYHLPLYELLNKIFKPLRSSYDLLLSNFWHTIFFYTSFCLRFFVVRSFALYDHLPTNFWDTNIQHTDFYPVTVKKTGTVECIIQDTFLKEHGANVILL